MSHPSEKAYTPVKADEIRSQFFNFFQSRGHQILPSAPVINREDPNLLFTNAGMNPFKAYFLGQAPPPHPRIADTQKCLRVSGKHNDLEAVGRDTYHHTFFEMLGNWSFGDYFKAEAIAWAWEFLTQVLHLDEASLYVTIFGGDPNKSLDRDEEALGLWKQRVSEGRILLGDKRDNFWEMGEQGPCGPCSEIHIDLRDEAEKRETPGAECVNRDHPQVIEVWNLVFMTFNRKADGSLEPLPQKQVDTGMGFERLLMALEGVDSSYDTAVFRPLIRAIEKHAGVRYGAQADTDVAIRVVADHLRAVSSSIADGQLPGPTAAGYVIRRILRRALRYGFTFLHQKEAFLHKLVEPLVGEMGAAFPELKTQADLITQVIREEEQAFLRTLAQGLKLLENLTTHSKSEVISGREAFTLYDTYGFPKDLTALILREKGFSLDEAGFEEAMKQQRERSRQAAASAPSDWIVLRPEAEAPFVGYDQLTHPTRLTRYREVKTQNGAYYDLVLEQTPFYPEGGGQVGDRGHLETASGTRIPIRDTQKENNLILHRSEALPEDPTAAVQAVVDAGSRAQTAANHSATHLLHQALRTILGSHVAQKGSWVGPQHLRFDFSHFAKLSPAELQAVEDFVNARIEADLKCEEERDLPFEEALARGALALFGEKYGERVRSIRFGDSTELCGGTHVAHSGLIWHFKICAESAVAAGIRRIEALTGQAVKDYYAALETQVQALKSLFKNTGDPIRSIQSLLAENQTLKKKLRESLRDSAQNLKADLLKKVEPIGTTQAIIAEVELGAAEMKDLAFALKKEMPSLYLVLGSRQNGKALLAVACSEDLVERGFHAGHRIRYWAKAIQGGGGGQPFFATAGGRDPEGLGEALKSARAYLLEHFGSA